MSDEDNFGTRRFTVQRGEDDLAVFELDGVALDGDGIAAARECIEAQGGVYDLRGEFFACQPTDEIREHVG